VRARDAYGNRVESAPLSVTTPANLTLDFLTNQEEIWFSWTQSTDNVDSQSKILYDGLARQAPGARRRRLLPTSAREVRSRSDPAPCNWIAKPDSSKLVRYCRSA